MRAVQTTLCCVLLVGAFACETEPRHSATKYKTELFDNCAPCHGELGQGNEAIGAPAIAGLQSWYVRSQLYKFRQGIRGTHSLDIEGAKMRPMANTLVNDENMGLITEYVASMTPNAVSNTLDGGDAARGGAIFLKKDANGQIVGCANCHGTDGGGDFELRAPRLTGNADWYLFTQLKKFKYGVRGAHERDKWGQNMAAQTNLVADEEAMLDVIAYIRTLGKE